MSEHTPREHSYSPGEDGSAAPQLRDESPSRSRYEHRPRCVTRDDVAPLFQADAFVNGSAKKIKLSDYKGDWVVLFFYSSDFTFV